MAAVHDSASSFGLGEIALGLALGAALAAGIGLLLKRSGKLTDTPAMAVGLIVIAVFYPIFGILAHRWEPFLQQAAIATPFILLALVVLRMKSSVGLLLIGVAVCVHALVDLGFLLAVPVSAPGPAWYPLLCIGFDLVFAALLFAAARGSLGDRSNT